MEIGNIYAKRDWGYSGDYVKAMWQMLQLDKPDDFVISTGETHSVKDFIDEAFKTVYMDITWSGEGLNEVGKVDGKIVVKINPKFYRPAEVDVLIGDCSKAKTCWGWEPQTKFKELVKLMVESDWGDLK
jgi:GDPmannose 4,6-dehydratase